MCIRDSLEADAADVEALAAAFGRLRKDVRHCPVCRNVAEGELCSVCASSRRDRTRICVVEMPHDVSRIEETGAFNGVYHVLLGRLSPDRGTGPDELGLAALLERVEKEGVQEVVIATNPNVAGDATADYISGLLRGRGVKVTRPARGLPAGSELQFLRPEALSDAMRHREALG